MIISIFPKRRFAVCVSLLALLFCGADRKDPVYEKHLSDGLTLEVRVDERVTAETKPATTQPLDIQTKTITVQYTLIKVSDGSTVHRFSTSHINGRVASEFQFFDALLVDNHVLILQKSKWLTVLVYSTLKEGQVDGNCLIKLIKTDNEVKGPVVTGGRITSFKNDAATIDLQGIGGTTSTENIKLE